MYYCGGFLVIVLVELDSRKDAFHQEFWLCDYITKQRVLKKSRDQLFGWQHDRKYDQERLDYCRQGSPYGDGDAREAASS